MYKLVLCIDSNIQTTIVSSSISVLVSIIGFLLILKQNRISRQNQFETTFFNLLNYFREIYNSTSSNIYKKPKNKFDHKISIGEFSKSDFFKQLYNSFQNEYLIDNPIENVLKIQRKDYIGIKENHSKNYNDFYKNYQSQLDLYFGSLLNLIAFVDENLKNKDDKIKYINFLKNQLGEYELIMMYYHSKLYNNAKFTAKINNFSFIFENLNKERIQYNAYY